MNCKLEEEFNDAIEQGRAINETHPDQTAETTVAFLDNTTGSVIKHETGYGARGLLARIKESVTQKVERLKPFRGKANPLLDQQGNIGNYSHDVMEQVASSIVAITNGMSNDSAYSYVKNLTDPDYKILDLINAEYGRSMSRDAFDNIFDGIKENVLSIYRQQRAINKLTNKTGKATIKLEQIVLDPKRGIGGTIDFLAIFSDNTAAIVDYKTKILKAGNKDAFGKITDFTKLVTNSAVEKYKLQTGEYGRILREAYGVRSIASVTILPITLDLKFDSKTKTYNSKIDRIHFPGQDPLLEKVLPFSNLTRFKSLDEFVRSIDERIVRLTQKVKNTPADRDELLSRIKDLEKAKKDILINHNLDTIIEYGKSLAKRVSDAELGKLDISELQDIRDELTLLASMAESTYEYREFLKGTSKQAMLDSIKDRIGELTAELKDKLEVVKAVLFEDKITKLIELHTGYKILDDYGNYTPFAQEGYFGKWFYQLSQYENPVFKTLRSILDDINYNVRQKTESAVDEIKETEDKVYNWLKSTGRSFEDFVKIMINPTTDNFWGKYEPEYFDTLNRANGSTLYQYYEPSEKYHETYQDRLDKAILKFKDQGLKDKALDTATNEWIKDNDLSLDVDGHPVFPGAWENNRNYWLTMKDNPSEYNEHYRFIQSVPELRAYYSMFEKYNKEFRKLLDIEYNTLPNNFLPNIRKSMSERISEQGFNGFISGTQDFFKDFSIREEDRSADTSYNSNSQIPIFFLTPFKSEDKELQVGEKSYQFGKSLAIFAKMAYNYRASLEREAEILALQDFLSTEAEQITQSRGRNLIDQMGNQITEKLQATDLPDIFRSFVDMYVYKINVKSIIGDKSGKAERMLLKAKEYFTLKALGFNVIAGLGSLASAKINTLVEANKGIIFNKTNYNEAMKASWTEREKFLAINAYFDPMGHRLNSPVLNEKNYGERQYGDSSMKGFINKYVNSRMLMNVFSIGDEYIEEMITAAMAKNYYIDKLGNLRRIKNDADLELNKDRLIWNLFSYSKDDGPKLDISEEQMASAFQDFRRAIQTGQSRIKGTIPEEDKAHWQTNIIGQLVMHFKSWMPGIIFERFGKVKFDSRIDSMYMGKYISLSQEFHNPDKLVLKEFFKKIFLPKLAKLGADIATFGMLSNSRLNDKHNKQLAFEKWLDLNPHYKGKVSFEDFNEVQQKQLKSVIQELRVLLTFTVLLLMLMGDWNGDDEPDYKMYLLTRKLVSLMLKTQQELSFVYSPVSFTALIKSPLPVLGLVSDAYKTILNTVDELLDLPFGEDRLIGGESKDKKPVGSESLKWLPGMGGVLRFLDIFNDDTQYLNTMQ